MSTENIIFGVIGVALGYYIAAHFIVAGRPA